MLFRFNVWHDFCIIKVLDKFKILVMQIFLIGNVLETAKCLDNRRLNRQIIEVKQIISAIEGKTISWRNHPVTIMYENDLNFLRGYKNCLIAYKDGRMSDAMYFSEWCERTKPDFLKNNGWYFENMKNLLYTKNKEYYSNYFPYAIESFSNFYYVNDVWKEYKQN